MTRRELVPAPSGHPAPLLRQSVAQLQTSIQAARIPQLSRQVACEGKAYTIQEKAAEPRNFPLRDSPVALGTYLLTWSCWVYYLVLRFRACLHSQHISKEWLLLICELSLLAQDFLAAVEPLLTVLPSDGPLNRPSLCLVGDSAPMVHVFVTVCGEKLDIIQDTVAAAAVQSYPRSCYQVFVLDDARSSTVRDAVESFNAEKGVQLGLLPVVYLARHKPVGTAHWFKSGNLRFGLDTTRDQYGGSDFFANLDADMIVEYEWLARTVPHLIRSPDCAIISPPAQFYNILGEDMLSQDSHVSQQLLEPLRDRNLSSQCSGSGFVIRRKALEAIGGWPLANVGEDSMCSFSLMAAGYKTAYLHEGLQFGLAPGSFYAYIKQRLRWTAGSLIVAKKFRFFIPGLAKFYGWTPSQYTLAMLYACREYIASTVVFPMLVLPLILGTTNQGAPYNPPPRLRYALLLMHIGSSLSHYFLYRPIGLKNAARHIQNRYWSVQYHLFCICKSWIADVEQTTFAVTGTVRSHADERSRTRRQPFLRRMASPLVLLHVAYWLYAAVGLAVWLCHALALRLYQRPSAAAAATSYPYTGLTLGLVEIVFAAALPVRYMAFPPTVGPRRQYLVRDGFGVYRSRKKTWTKRDAGVGVKHVLGVLIILVFDWL